MATKGTVMSGEGLIKADGLPDDLLRSLNHEQIQQVGYFLFSQLVKQRDASLKTGRREVVEWVGAHWFYATCTNVNGQTMTYRTLWEYDWQAQLKNWRLVCSRCGAIRTDNIDSDTCGTCADDLRQEQEAR